MTSAKIIDIKNHSFNGVEVVERSISFQFGKHIVVAQDDYPINEDLKISKQLKITFRIGFYSKNRSKDKQYFNDYIDNSFLFDGKNFKIGEITFIPNDSIDDLKKGNTYKLGLLYIKIEKYELLD